MLLAALRFAAYDPARTLGALLALVVAVFLIGQQIGIFLFLTGLMTALPDRAHADLWVTDARTSNANVLRPLDTRLARYLAAVPGVAGVRTIVVAGATGAFADGVTAPVTLVGSDPPELAAGPWNLITGDPRALLRDGALTVDQFDRAILGGTRLGDAFEIGGRRVTVVGETRGARGFGSPLLFTTTARARALGGVPSTRASAFLVEVAAGVDSDDVRARIAAAVPGVRAWRRDELSAATRRTVLATSGIGLSVGTLIVVAVAAGFATVSLTMYASAMERLRDYGTLKAIGATHRVIVRMLLAQAGAVAVLGFVVGGALVVGFALGVAPSGVVIDLAPSAWLGLAGATLAMAVAGALVAARRLGRLEPAAVFRG